MSFNMYEILSTVPEVIATLASLLMLSIGITATFWPSSFVTMWMKRGAGTCNPNEKDAIPVGYFLVVGGIGAGALSVAVTSLLSLWKSYSSSVVGGGIVPPMPSSMQEYLTTSRILACGTLSILSVYAVMWYAGGMAKRLKTYGLATNVAFVGSLSFAVYALLFATTTNDAADSSSRKEETSLAMIQNILNVLIPWTFAHYVNPHLLEYTFSIQVSPGEEIVCRAGCSFFLANQVLQASLAYGWYGPLESVCLMAIVMLVSSLDFQRRCNPKWGYGQTADGVEIDWSNVNGHRTWSIVSLGIAMGLACR